MRRIPVIALLVTPCLAVFGMVLPALAQNAEETPPHPEILWATSEELSGETAPNGRIAALVDDDSGRPDHEKSFWTTKWSGGTTPFPHAFAMTNPLGDAGACGLLITARPTWGTTYGNDHLPAEYFIHGFDADPGNPAESDSAMMQWRESIALGEWTQGERLANGPRLIKKNEPQVIPFTKTSKAVITLTGLRAMEAEKNDMALSDVKVLRCDAAGRPIIPAGVEEPSGGDPEVPHPDAPEEGSGSDTLVTDFIIDQLPYGEAGAPVGFAPTTHTYTAMAYYHADTVSARIKTVEGARVTINGAAVNAQGRVSGLALEEGLNLITAVVSKGSESATYVVNILKKPTDFRGHVLIPASVSLNGGSDENNAALVDGDRHTSYTAKPLVRAAEWNQSVTGFEIDLGEARYVHRVNGFGRPELPAGTESWHGGNSVAIAVQDEGGEWKTIVTHASLTRDAGGIWYWDFNAYHRARRIRVWMNIETEPQTPRNVATGVTFEEIEVWGLPAGQEPVAPDVDNTSFEKYRAFNPQDGQWGVNRAQTLALQYGIMMPTWIPSEGYGRGGFDARERDLTEGAFPMFYDLPMFNTPLMESLGEGSPWAIAKAPFGKNGISAAGSPRDFLTDIMRPYAETLVDIQYGDEGGFSRTESDNFGRWFEWSKRNIPGALVHANSWNDPSWYKAENLDYYVRNAKPDLLSWDTYYYSPNSGPKPDSVVLDLLNTQTWKAQREYALKGLTGDGSSPILYGQYLDYNWDANVSESQKAIVPSLGLATGQKWFGLFRMEYNGYDRSSIIDYDGAPTRSFYEFSKIFGHIEAIGAYTKAMTSTFVAYKPGSYEGRENGVLKGYTYGNFAEGSEAKAANESVGLKDVTVRNAGSVNAGRPGDVVIGYFEQLDGLSPEKSREIFGGSTSAPRGFLVVNALTGTTEFPSFSLNPRNDDGSFAETAQDIVLVLSKPSEDARLILVDPQAGLRREVDLGEGPTASVTLSAVGGGDARFLYWVTGGSSQD